MAQRRKVRLSVPTLGEREARVAASIIRSGHVTQGERVKQFEAAMLRFLDADERAALMVNSGSSANLLIADFLRNHHAKGQRTRVVTTALTWSTAIAPLIQNRLDPVFVDVGPDLTMAPEAAKAALDDLSEAKAGAGLACALMPVHLLGHPCNMPVLRQAARQHDVALVEDCCEALNASWDDQAVGTFGDYASFSFYFSHHLSTIEGGLLVVAAEKAKAARSLREHGWVRDYPESEKAELRAEDPALDARWIFDRAGYNVRSTEINAAIGLLQLKQQAAWHYRRIAIAEWYAEHLQSPWFSHPFTSLPLGARANPFSYPLIVEPNAPFERWELAAWLETHRVETRPIMSGNITRHPWLRKAGYPVSDLPMTDRAHRGGLLLPCHPKLTRADLGYVRDTVEAFLRSRRAGGVK